jgi:hypothetical protein
MMRVLGGRLGSMGLSVRIYRKQLEGKTPTAISVSASMQNVDALFGVFPPRSHRKTHPLLTVGDN